MSFIVDGSFGLVGQHITGQQLAGIGASGVIGYVSSDPAKNMTAAMLDDYLSVGLSVGLVWENGERDMLLPIRGIYAGQMAVSQAHAIGYDVGNCVIYTAADWNVQPADLPAVNQYMANFRHSVPHPGIYSNRRALDMLAVTGNASYFWQSNSTSFSNGVSLHANLLQRYGDHRAGALPVDVNDILGEPLGMMGGNMAQVLGDDDRAWIMQQIGTAVHATATLVHQDDAGTQQRTVEVLQTVAAESATLQQLAGELTASGVAFDYDKMASALAAHLLVQVSAKP